MSDSAFSQSPNSSNNMEIQQTRVSPSRLAAEAELLLECINITSEDSENIQQEIRESPLESTIFDILTKLFEERESEPCNLVETARDSSEVVDTNQKLDDKLKHENIICTDKEDTDFSHLDDKDINSSALHEYKNKVSKIKQVRLFISKIFTGKLYTFQQVFDTQQSTLNTLCDECEKGVMTFFNDQPQCIPIKQAQVESIIQGFRTRTLYIYLELKTNVAETVEFVQKVMFEKSSKRRKRNFSKQASEILNEYFYSNLDNRYPCEEIKADLATLCKITVGQVSKFN